MEVCANYPESIYARREALQSLLEMNDTRSRGFARESAEFKNSCAVADRRFAEKQLEAADYEANISEFRKLEWLRGEGGASSRG